MKPDQCVTDPTKTELQNVCSQAILYPLRKSLTDFEPGTLSINFRKRPGTSNERVMQVQVIGCRDTMQTPSSDTVVLNYTFTRIDKWYTVVISLDASANSDGVVRLYVDGNLVVSQGSRFVCTAEPPNGEGPWKETFSALRVAPASIGSWHDGETIQSIFRGLLDEFAIFSYTLTEEQISQQFSNLNRPNRVVPVTGYAAIVEFNVFYRLPVQDSGQ